MRTFTQLSLEERELLFMWNEQGIPLRDIGRRLGRTHTTVSRELKRNAKYGQPYIPCRADRKAKKRALKQRYRAPLKEPLIFLYVREHLRQGWSPETIAGRLSIDYPGYSIDDETIYRYVYGKNQRRMKLWKHLTLHRKRRMKKDGRKVRGVRIPDALPLESRPEKANLRTEPGHWETDNMEGKRNDRTSVSVSVDRMIRITRLRKLADHTAKEKARVLRNQFINETPQFQKSFTFDRGAENSHHKKITRKTNMPAFACTAYHSWEKGTVENTIGRVRRYIPKGTSVDAVSQRILTDIEDVLNNTPRKCLGYLTPNEMLEKIYSASHTC